jgi:Family of unknown function (DUF5519)
MAFPGAQIAIRDAVTKWEGVTEGPHRFGAVGFWREGREVGHIHGDALADIPFPLEVRNEVVQSGEALPHHIVPQSGWVSVPLHSAEDVPRAIALFRRSYELRGRALRDRELQGREGEASPGSERKN